MMRMRTLLQSLLVCVGIAASAQAALTVRVGDLQLAPNGTGLLDVFISGEDDLLAAFQFELLITPTSGTSSLRFVDPQPDLALDLNPEYIFSGNSLGYITFVSGTVVPGDTLDALDLTANGDNVLVGASEKLLGRVAVMHDSGAADPPTTIGHTFRVELVPLNTLFVDKDGNFAVFAGDPGQVRIVPEPSQLTIMLGLGGLGLVGCGWRRRRRPAGA